MAGEGAFGEAAFGETPSGPTLIIPEVADVTKTLIFVVELDMLDTTVSPAQEVTRRYASHSFVTRSTDTPAHMFIPGRVTRGLTIGRRISTTDAGEFGPLIQSRFGEIELNNVDGELDELIDDFYVDGREIRLYIGATEIDGEGREVAQAYADFELVYTARSGAWEAEHDVLRLKVEDRGKEIQEPLQSVYAGTGGIEGDETFEGRAKPVALGRILNAEAQLIDPAQLIYQINDGPIQFPTVGEMVVRDAGVVIPNEGGVGQIPPTDYADYDALAADLPPAGVWRMSSADALIALGTEPTGVVAVDFATIPWDDVQLHGNAIKTLLINRSSLESTSPPTDLDENSFDALDVAQTCGMGIYFEGGTRPITVEDAIAQIAFSAGAFVGQDRSGLYRVQRLEDPSGVSPADWSFAEHDIIRIEREPLPYRIPWRRWGVAYDRNSRVMSQNEIAPSVSSRLFYSSEARFKFADDPAIAAVHPTASQAPLRLSLFQRSVEVGDPDPKVHAQAEADRLIALYGLGRAIYRVVVKTTLFSMELGQTVQLTYPRWNLAGGRTFVIVEINDDADRIETEFRCFG